MRRKRRSKGRVTSHKKRKRAIRLPKATVSMVPKQYDLASCPGGYVKLRRMTYGELMASQDLAYQVQMKQAEDSSDPELGLTVTRAAIMEYQLKICVMEHNLENDTGQLLDFRRPPDVHLLDSNIGQEIAAHIETMHDWKKKYPNSEEPSSNSSSTGSPSGVATSSSDPSETLPSNS